MGIQPNRIIPASSIVSRSFPAEALGSTWMRSITKSARLGAYSVSTVFKSSSLLVQRPRMVRWVNLLFSDEVLSLGHGCTWNAVGSGRYSLCLISRAAHLSSGHLSSQSKQKTINAGPFKTNVVRLGKVQSRSHFRSSTRSHNLLL